MSNRLKLIYGLIVMGVVACAPAATPTATPPAPSGLLIQYERSGGIGGFNETWSIYADGRVEHSGRGSGRALQLSPDQIATLVAAMRAANFTSWKESYVPLNSCCDRFMYVMTLTLDGQTKTVRTLDAAPDEPPTLTAVLSAINAILQ